MSVAEPEVAPVTMSDDEIIARGKVIYYDKIRSLVEPKENGKYIVIEIRSGDYEIGRDDYAIEERLMARHPGGVFYLTRVGARAAYSFGGAI